MTEKQEVLSDLLLISTTVKAAIIKLFYVLCFIQTGICDYFEFCPLIILNKLDNIRLPNAIPKYMLFLSAEKRHKQMNIAADSNKPTLAIVSNLQMIFLSIFISCHFNNSPFVMFSHFQNHTIPLNLPQVIFRRFLYLSLCIH